MADDQNSGEKTEKATPKRLRDARKRGEIAKSRDTTSTLGLAFLFVLLGFGTSWGVERLVLLTNEALSVRDGDFGMLLRLQGRAAAEAFVLLSALALVPIAAFGLLAEFLQSGPVLAFEKVKPKLSNLDPVGGVKRMFGADNLVEVIKSLVKTTVILLIGWSVVAGIRDQLVWLPSVDPVHLVEATRHVLVRLLGWILAVFVLLTLFDLAWQRHSFAKKMRMSIRDVRKEFKDNEGDPLMRSQRKQMHQEWAQEGANAAARTASVVVVNPTHVAVAIRYDAEEEPVPLVTAKGRDEQARAIRTAANEAHVPVLRNELLAHRLLHEVDEGEVIPDGLFDVVAAVIVWAREARESMRTPAERTLDAGDETPPRPPPGEDLTRYPDHGPSWLGEEQAVAQEDIR